MLEILTPILALLAAAQATSPAQAGCLDARGSGPVEVSGRLTVQVFPGPPNYQSVESGDLAESSFILELPQRRCLEDGEFLEPGTTFDRAHLYGTNRLVSETLNASVGRTIRVRGDGSGAHTGRHHAPLVIEVSEVAVEGE